MLKSYFDNITADLSRESQRIRESFKTHRPSGGANREDLVAKLLSGHILPSVGIETGLVLSSSGEFSSQSDILLVDRQSNTALHAQRPVPLWLVEAVYGVIEVKTQLTPTEIADSIQKCRRFKQLPLNFADSFAQQKISDSLFCIWSFDAPQPERAKENLKEALKTIPRADHPDFIIAPGNFLFVGGKYNELRKMGQVGSEYYNNLLASVGGDTKKMMKDDFDMLNLGDNTIAVFLYWLNAWLFGAGPRRPHMLAYYPTMLFGSAV